MSIWIYYGNQYFSRPVYSNTQRREEQPVSTAREATGTFNIYHKDLIHPNFVMFSLTHFHNNRLQASLITAKDITFHTRFRCLSASVFWLYHGSSRNGSLCHTYFRTVFISALLIRMQRYTMRNTFIDLKHRTVMWVSYCSRKNRELHTCVSGRPHCDRTDQQ